MGVPHLHIPRATEAAGSTAGSAAGRRHDGSGQLVVGLCRVCPHLLYRLVRNNDERIGGDDLIDLAWAKKWPFKKPDDSIAVEIVKKRLKLAEQWLDRSKQTSSPRIAYNLACYYASAMPTRASHCGSTPT